MMLSRCYVQLVLCSDEKQIVVDLARIGIYNRHISSFLRVAGLCHLTVYIQSSVTTYLLLKGH